MELHSTRRLAGGILTGLVLLAAPVPIRAAWSHDPFVGNPVSTDTGHARANILSSVADGQGGTLHAWLDPGGLGVGMQHLDADGNPLWGGTAGIAVFNEDLGARSLAMCSDGAGGAYLAIEDGSPSRIDDVIYVQHVDASGNALFTLDPIMATPAHDPTTSQRDPQIVTDGAGGVYVVWHDTRNAAQGLDLFGQHVDATGAVLWGASGLSLVARTEDQWLAGLVTDDVGGFYMAWFDYNGVAVSDPPNAVMTHVDSAGSSAGFSLSGEHYLGSRVADMAIAADGLGNAAVVFSMSAAAGEPVAYLSCDVRDIDGNTRFWAGTVQVTDGSNQVGRPRAVAGPSGRIYVAWQDGRGGGTIYSQALEFHGTALWTANGVAVDPNAPVVQGWPSVQLSVSSDGYPTYVWDSNYGDIHAQQLNPNGIRRWPSPSAVTNAPSDQKYPTVTPAPDGSMVFAWADSRGGAEWTMWAQRIDRFGYPGNPAPTITTVTDYPQDQGGKVRLSWTASYLDDYTESGLGNYTVWNRLAGAKAYSGTVLPAALAAIVKAGGIDEAAAAAALADGWTYIDQVPAAYLPQYAYNAPTFADSVAGGAPLTEFMVLGHYGSVSWPSAVRSGLSVDNLSPGAPQFLTANLAGGDVALNWRASGNNDEDLKEYHIYRAAAAGVTPEPGNLVGVATTPDFSEPLPAGGGVWHYVVTAVDLHGNEGLVSNEVATPTVSAVGGGTTPAQFALRGNSPNPFNPATEITFDLPREAQVRLAVFDIAGRRVATLVDGTRPAGTGSVRWNGRDDGGRALPSGIYFARMVAGDYRGVWKMMLTK